MSFKDQMASDARACFFNTNEFAETISYTPKNDIARSIPAIVDRKPEGPQGVDQQRAMHDRFEVYLPDNATGIAEVAIGDILTIPDEAGVDTEYAVVNILDHSFGSWHVEVEK